MKEDNQYYKLILGIINMANKIRICNCGKCGHRWASRIKNPGVCPKCHSYKWREKKQGILGWGL